MTDTVKLHVTIDVHVDVPAADTGVSVDKWNAMDPRDRMRIVQEVWESAVVDQGGVSVVTPGAEEI